MLLVPGFLKRVDLNRHDRHLLPFLREAVELGLLLQGRSLGLADEQLQDQIFLQIADLPAYLLLQLAA
ncbi:hypothetical protein D3C73_1521840 [compost metagenome]